MLEAYNIRSLIFWHYQSLNTSITGVLRVKPWVSAAQTQWAVLSIWLCPLKWRSANWVTMKGRVERFHSHGLKGSSDPHVHLQDPDKSKEFKQREKGAGERRDNEDLWSEGSAWPWSPFWLFQTAPQSSSHCTRLRRVSWLHSDDGICFTVMLTGMEPSLLGQLSVLWTFADFDPHSYCCFQAMTRDAFKLEGK